MKFIPIGNSYYVITFYYLLKIEIILKLIFLKRISINLLYKRMYLIKYI
jgi:hypothetical protein